MPNTISLKVYSYLHETEKVIYKGKLLKEKEHESFPYISFFVS